MARRFNKVFDARGEQGAPAREQKKGLQILRSGVIVRRQWHGTPFRRETIDED